MDLPKTLDLNYPPGFGEWVLPLKTRLQKSSSTRLRRRLQESHQGDLWEKALALSTTFALGERIVSKINERLTELGRDLEDNRQDVLDCLSSGVVYNPTDKNAILDLLADLDAFIFEFESAREKLKLFLRAFYTQIFERDVRLKKLRGEVLSWGIDLSWEKKLNGNLFDHGSLRPRHYLKPPAGFSDAVSYPRPRTGSEE